MKHVEQRDNRWCIVDLVGKHGRVRTIPMPRWTKNAIDAYAPAPAAPHAASLFDAMEKQLGLRLDSGRGLGEYLMVDRVERPSQK